MNSDEIRQAFLKFFEERGHEIKSSSSLVPKGDPTLLLTSAGMVQMKPYFLGEAKPPNPRLASCQKCFRTTDIDDVGDATHLTFFEMLGNFSVGDYFKKETINWAYELITQTLKITPERLWVTVFLDDDEAADYWLQAGIPQERILRFGEEHNFWGPVGDSGPCGPDVEIFYDFGEGVGCGKADCRPNCECGRFTEINTLVFMEYNQDKDGRRSPLPRPSIDTGMGLERTAAVLQNKLSVYETDLFTPLLERISRLTSQKYGVAPDDDTAMRVLADHGRAVTFLIADGVIPGNEGRGYVLRRLLRRATLFGQRLGLDKPFLSELALTTIKQMNHIYPELKQRQEFIVKAIRQEEVRFAETLKTGLEVIESIMAEQAGSKEKQISGIDAFRLYDTYGFPVELTKEVVEKSGYSVDMGGFEKEMERQRERARASQKFDIEAKAQLGFETSAQLQHEIGNTEFVGYTCLEQAARVVRLLVDGRQTDKIETGQEASVVLDTSPFYGEMGGQLGDTGEIVGGSGLFAVTDTVRIEPDIIVHKGEVTEGSLIVGEEVKAVVDIERRLDIARNHTATHLLQAALREVLGEHIQQRGSLVAPDRLRFDFSHLAPVTPDEINRVRRIVNDMIRRNLRVYDEDTSYREAVNAGVIAIFDEKYGDVVRVLKIGEPAESAELCGGTHVSATGEIGYFHIVSEEGIGAGLRRIEAVTGRGAEAFVEQRFSGLESITHALEATPETVREKLDSLMTALEDRRKYALSLERELAKKEVASLLDKVELIKDVNILSARVVSSNQQVLREMADTIRDRLKSVIVVLGTISGNKPYFVAAVTPDLVQKGYNAGKIIKQVAKITGGGGGGRADFAQAGGKHKNKLDEALNLVRQLI
jgi:alanyl-tRNA synthetase